MSAWQEFALHQMSCAVCADNCYDCDTALSFMTAIRKLSPESKQWLDSEGLDAALKGGQE